mgnify:CR=1 FL=1
MENFINLVKQIPVTERIERLKEQTLTEPRYLTVEQFPTEKSLLESIVSAELRPASRTAVYLTVRYHPYESVHVYDFEAVRQAVLTADA